MKYALLALVMAFSVSDASAAVYCAAGRYHAGCVRRPVGVGVVAPVHRAVVVGPRCRVVNGFRRCI